jgi:hypothetical protein
VITSQIDDYELAAASLEDAIDMASDLDESEIWILGGAAIYKEAIEKKLIDTLHISHIPYDGPADRYFPNFMMTIDGVSHGETIYSPLNDKSFRYKVYEMEKNHRNNNGLLDFSGSFLRPVTSSLPLMSEMGIHYPSVGYSTASEIRAEAGLPPFDSTTVQGALTELDNNLRQMTGVTWVQCNGDLLKAGDTRYNTAGYIETLSDSGDILRIVDMEFSSPVLPIRSPQQALYDIVQGELNRYVGSKMDSSEIYGIGATLRDRIYTAIKDCDEEADIHISMNYNTQQERAPVYVMGSMMPVAYSSANSTTTITLQLAGIFRNHPIERLELQLTL